MSRSERWNTINEIKRKFHESTDPLSGAGPIVYVENGRKYSDDGESHIAVIGRTGKGKSQCCSLPYMREVLQKGESLIMLDPKGEGYKKNACYIPENYQRYCVDFRNPRKSPSKWNPLTTPYRLFCSKNPDDNDIASSMLSELWNGVFPYDGHSDKFWTDSAVNYAKGLTYGLFETAPNDQINLDSVAVMMEQSEIRISGSPNTVAKAFYDQLPSDSLAKRNLATYVTGPNETRASIHSVATAGLEVFSRSKGLMEMLSEDTLNIMDIDVNRPFALIVIIPDETDAYDALAGLLVSQVSQHLIRVAQEIGGKLPIRVNFILEELGSVGNSIPSLPNLMVASRSRNMRLMLVLQSNAQLDDVYGKSKAETINSCIGITIGFSTNSWETLKEWAQRCGEKQTENGGRIIMQPLITPPQLAAMPTGTALVMVDSQYKFIVHLPFYDEMYDNTSWEAPQNTGSSGGKQFGTINFESMVKNMVKKQYETAVLGKNPEKGKQGISSHVMNLDGFQRGDIDALLSAIEQDPMISEINAKLAELEAEEKKTQGKRTEEKKYHVTVVSNQDSASKIVKIIADTLGESFDAAAMRLNYGSADIAFATRKEATNFAKDISNAGGKATVRTSE